ncbi:uncharacterized protein LOC121048798 isoform X3 [Rosa chinensis]|uniref:uncharacterized protein LOC121048798 isoform X3 n=1 Tax=Rosa chinensis TaxID=74649 RepID=UPI001AD9494F|nr:uncharacterized protein LOC121048798 isoform X3 [Rosa chinensis]XP_040372116.1 uncharacterized protein LOC121048798 isoform X3 [Rosa chinensis]XP_040372118.1 uncharacterized protein LOC121048798 isoform X3 [Rosa chinensis]
MLAVVLVLEVTGLWQLLSCCRESKSSTTSCLNASQNAPLLNVSDWMRLLLPLAVERGTCIITNMGAMDPPGAQEKVIEIASSLGLSVTVAVAHEISLANIGSASHEKSFLMEGGISTYLGAAPIVECLEKYQPNVVITSRVADAALFLAPMIYELGWNWDNLEQLAQGSLAGHLLECGCQLTGGYFMHPGDKSRDMSSSQLLDLSLPYAEISSDGKVCVAKAEGSGGVLNFSTCAQQLLYEIGNPGAYVTPDVIIDIRDVSFYPLSSCKVLCAGAKPSAVSIPDKLLRLVPKDYGWKGWGEISYGGYECVKRAKIAEYLVRSWMEEVIPDVSSHVVSYIVGLDSLKSTGLSDSASCHMVSDIRLRMDGLFKLKEHAVQFITDFTALYTNGPAGGGGISTGHKKEIILEKYLVKREHVFWQTAVKHTRVMKSNKTGIEFQDGTHISLPYASALPFSEASEVNSSIDVPFSGRISPAPSGQKIPLYDVAHSRAGDKGNDLNFSIIPHFPPDVERLKRIITPQWVKKVVSTLLNSSSFPDTDAINERDKWVDENVKVEIYEVKGIRSLNVVVRDILDGGVNCSRRIDRHGKTISDLILCQQVVLPPWLGRSRTLIA